MELSGDGSATGLLQGLLAGLTPLGWIPWAVTAVLVVLSFVWAFAGNRGCKAISHGQGALIGLVPGMWGGAVMERAMAAGHMDFESLLFGPGELKFGIGALAGLVAGGLLFGFTGRFWSRLLFFAAGAAVGGGMVAGAILLLHEPLLQRLLPVLVLGIAAGGATLWLSFRHPVPFTGIWGGLIAALGLIWPMLHLFAIVGGPSWLPLLASGGLGALIAIAGTAWQADRQESDPHPIHPVRR